MRYSAGAVIETLVGFVIVIAAIVISIWAIVDAIRTPRDAFSAAGSSKALWLTLLLVFTVLAFFVTAVLGAVYLFRIRPRVRASMERAD
jgi:uncharacterized membrane protein